jgi:imidazolonepropionase-like amidohydrolase
MRQARHALGVCVLLADLGAAGGCAQPTVDAQAYEGARLLVGDGTVVETSAFVVEQGRITAVGRLGEVRAPAGARRVDLRGKTVMPALVNTHLHLGYEGYTSWSADRYTRQNILEHLSREAYYGVGAVLSAGTDPTAFALSLEREQAADGGGRARYLFAAGAAPPGGGPNDAFLRLIHASGEPTVHDLGDADGARLVARQLAAQGVRFVKIWVDDRNGAQPKLEPQVYRAFIHEAHAHGLKVLAHPQTAADARELLRAGIDGLLHLRLGSALDEESIRLMRERRVFVTPTLGLGEARQQRVFDDSFLQETVTPDVLARLRDAFDARPPPSPAAAAGRAGRDLAMQDAFARLIAADVPIVLGTDAGGLPDHFFGFADHVELEAFARLGMTPGQAIVAATGRSAEALGLTDAGTMAAGKRADFVVLDANPLDDIRNTRTIAAVYLAGLALDRDALRAAWSGAARRAP